MNVIEALNLEIRNAEFQRDIPFMEEALDENLVFRRANGKFTDKTNYIKDLKDQGNTYEHLEIVFQKAEMDEGQKLATAIVIIEAKGKRGANSYKGIYRNVRFFRKEENWKLYAWYNEALENNSVTLLTRHMEDAAGYKNEHPDAFCGQALIQNFPEMAEKPKTRAAYVRFEKASFTKWHFHTGPQILIATEGSGFVQQKDNHLMEMVKGDRVYIPEFVWHRHGAGKEDILKHIAITNGESIWDYEDTCEI